MPVEWRLVRYVQLLKCIDFWGNSEFNVMFCNSITINSHIKKIQQLPVTECPEYVTYTVLAIKVHDYMYIHVHVHSNLGVVTIMIPRHSLVI